MPHANRSLLLIAAACIGCASSHATINTYVDPTFEQGSIHSVAVFPIRNARFAPSEAQVINRQISTAIHSKNDSIHIVSSVEAVNVLNQHGLASSWAAFLANYVSSGVPDANTLHTIGAALGVDAIIQGEVVNVYQRDGAFGRQKGQTRVTVRFTMLDCRDGKAVWEASSDGVKGTATTVGEAPPIIDAVQLAMDKILNDLPL